ncbi:outer membrane beta-barrel protein [Dinghuibacter silviterrae]|uniref:Outer membrane protein with beta-barrel domain n=1 Tax=Dinghuibacter silviterrae TaxID=1539049 RepID=A0A4R8DHB4_9BACT|nr:outer membrane beta-barrel protein [Dinghuibacter silviterrae]TDW96624.1 outer membrane protein with beta-barrel domain [Dinghuibacter silviterrae]
MNLPEDHMDELYRKAGEMYPLKTDGADWDKVMARLQEASNDGDGGGAAPVMEGSSSRRWWWLMLLIVPFAWICTRYTHQGSTNEAAKAVVANAPAGKNGAAPAGAGGQSGQGTRAQSGQGTRAQSGQTVQSGQAASGGAAPVPGAQRAATAQSRPAASGDALTGAQATASRKHHTQIRTANYTARGNEPGAARTTEPTRAAALGAPRADQAGTRTLENATNPAVATAQKGIAQEGAAQEGPAQNGAAQNTQEEPPLSFAYSALDFALPMKPTPGRIVKTADTGFMPQHIIPKKVSGFYAGAIAGPDLSNVKWQELQNPGYSMGLLLGYRFNKSLSVEASALWAHKVYYTAGQYFSTKKTDIPPSDTLMTLKGNCSMFEIPINLRWDFLYTKSGSFYATAGLSSYMMKKEAYGYLAKDGYSSWWGDAKYLNSGNDFFSIMNLSVGYSLTWKGVGDVRIEPYFKIPLKGVGIGSLPITSTGLYLGLTHSFR